MKAGFEGAPSALIGVSNFFELAVATVVGALIEVPVMLLVVKIANATQGWYGDMWK